MQAESVVRSLLSRALRRRDLLKTGAGLGALGTVAATTGCAIPIRGPGGAQVLAPSRNPAPVGDHQGHSGQGMMSVGQVDLERVGMDPIKYLRQFEYGEVSRLPSGQVLREYRLTAFDREIEVAPGVLFPAWTYNGQVPAPTLRAVEGDRLRVHFVNAGSHPHTIHFHGIHSAAMDGVAGIGRGVLNPGEEFTYEFDAFPFGCHLFHCHATPLKRHIHKGLYGAFIIDPDPERYQGEERRLAEARNHQLAAGMGYDEMVIVMNAFDTNFDGENEVYSANTVAHYYVQNPIQIRRDQRQRMYLVNVTEFDPINSLHLHANFFDYYDHGTTLQPTLRTVDTVMQCQAQRGILEFSFAGFEPGQYMFHAHQTEFVELGWMSLFEVI